MAPAPAERNTELAAFEVAQWRMDLGWQAEFVLEATGGRWMRVPRRSPWELCLLKRRNLIDPADFFRGIACPRLAAEVGVPL